MDKHKEVRRAFRDGPDAENTNKRVRRHTWTDSPQQEPNPPKKQRHFSAPNAGASNGPDLLGSILSGMKSPTADTSKWEGQPNYSELGGKTQETRLEDRLVNEEPSSQWWSSDPLQLEYFSTAKMSKSSKSDNNLSKPHTAERLKPFQKFRKADKSDSRNIEKEREKLQAKARSLDYNSNNEKNKKLVKGIDVEWEPPKQRNKSNGKKNDERSHGKRGKDLRPEVKKGKCKKSDSKKENDSGLVNFNKKRSGISEKSKIKTSETPNGRGSRMGGAPNTDKEFKKGGKKKFPKEMEGTKSWRSKSSWKRERNLGSTRKAWRPDRAYDFGRNYMEINDVETPNDDFELARIV